MTGLIKIAVTMGDPGGIGPETALKAVCHSKWPGSIRFILIGKKQVWLKYARRLRLPRPAVCQDIKETGKNMISIWDPPPDAIPLPPGAGAKQTEWRAGKTGKSEGFFSLLWIRAAAAGCLDRTFSGMTTGPICKRSIQAAGCPFPGHTEYLAHLAGCRRTAMMLIGGPLRVVLVTTHLPLAAVPGALTRRNIIETADMAVLGVKWLNLRPKNIGICALNPHAGENGLLGNEERTMIAPAIRQLRRRGMAAEGPVPADAIFYQAMRNKFGAIVAMYHDQGLGPLKMIAFERGVNLTLGLPFVRTSPDHGTAFDIAGRKKASPTSMIAAIKLAVRLAQRPNPWKR